MNLGNRGNVSFALKNLELSVLATHREDRTRLVPVATLLPSAELITGKDSTFNLGALAADKGPFVFQNREVFWTLVEDLMRDPRGLVFRVVNYDLVDEFGRNFAFASQVALDRTANLVVDYGDGKVERFLVALNPFYDGPPDQGGQLIGGFDGQGRPLGIPVGTVLEEVLGLPHNATTPDAIVAGPNGISESIASGDDVQLVVGGIDGLLDDTLVITAGEDGVLNTTLGGDDLAVVTAGYETSPSCGADTPSVVIDGGNGIAETLADGDDVQVVPVKQAGITPFSIVVAAGANGFADTAPGGDDAFVGPGTPCTLHEVGCLTGTCSDRQVLTRFKHRREGSFGRFWTVILPDNRQLGLDFEKIVLRPGQTLSLAFVQDLDRDGVLAQQEYLYGSSDRRQDTDGDGLDDFSEIYVGWDIGVNDGSPIRRVFPDPRLADTDRDGLTDRIEQDIRRTRCLCADEARACTASRECGGGSCLDWLPLGDECARGGSCPTCPAEAIRTDPRSRDTDLDLIGDSEEVLGFLSGPAISQSPNAILAGSNGKADTLACPDDVCDGGLADGAPCRTHFDCPAGICPMTGCDDVQVQAHASQGHHPRSVVVGAGLNGVLETEAVSGDSLVSAVAGSCETAAVADDRALVSVSSSASAAQTLIRPGINGEIDSVPAGDDVYMAGEIFLVSNPLDPDTDSDLISDGIERILGSDPTDPRDAGAFADRDEDGLSDSEEETVGWAVTVDGSTRRVYSNSRVADTDGDGLPDYAERVLGTDPNMEDTDQDGLNDIDEISADTLGSLAQYKRYFTNYPLATSDLKAYGTNPLLRDSDGDGRADRVELFESYNVAIPGESQVRTGLTDPTRADSDADGVDDRREIEIHGTDPLDPDTDDDGRLDGVELGRTDPRVPDISVRIRLASMELDGGDSDPLWEHEIYAQHSSDFYPGTSLYDTDSVCAGGEPRNVCGVSTRRACRYPTYKNLYVNTEVTFALREGQGIVLNGYVNRLGSCTGTLPRFECQMRFTEEPLSFASLNGQGFSTRKIQLSNENCKATVLYEIEVNQ